MSWQEIALNIQQQVNSSISDWEEEPVSFRTFVESPDFCNLEKGLSSIQYEDIEAVIGTNPKLLFSPERDVIIGALLYGKGSGKGFMSSFVGAYVVYVLLCLRNPQAFFDSGLGEHLDILFVARKKAQVSEVAFAKFLNRVYLKNAQGIQSCRWFYNNFLIIEEGKKKNSPINSRGTIKINSTKVEFPKQIFVYPESSNNESFEGYNIIFWILDEISAFVSDKERVNGRKILNTLRNSAVSRSTSFVKGFGLCLSFPRREDDIMFDLLQESTTDKEVYARLRFPWQVKPRRYFSKETFEFRHERVTKFLGVESIDIPVVPYRSQFDSKNTEKVSAAMMMFLCIPQAAERPYFGYIDKVDQLIDENRMPLFDVESYLVVDPIDSSKYLVKNKIVKWNYDSIELTPYYKFQRVIHVDLAKNHCRATLTLGHFEVVALSTSSGIINKKVKVIDDVIYWVPDIDHNVQISIVDISAFIFQIMTKVPVKVVSYDRWNSEESIERFRNSGIEAIEVGSASSYSFLRTDIYESNMIFSNSPGCLEAKNELLHIQTDATGEKVRKGDYFSDAADGIASVSFVLERRRKQFDVLSSRSMGKSIGGKRIIGISNNSKSLFDIAFEKHIDNQSSIKNLASGISRSMGKVHKK